MKKTELKLISVKNIVTLKRNPQYLTPKQMDSLKESIQRDGFCAPILVRSLRNKKYEVISGNHRFMAACEIGLKEIPCVVSNMTTQAAKRLAINLNTIHGEPNVELLAPFLAEMEIETLQEIHIEIDLKNELIKFDDTLEKMFSKLEVPDEFNRESPQHKLEQCKCPTCGRKHFKAEL